MDEAIRLSSELRVHRMFVNVALTCVLVAVAFIAALQQIDILPLTYGWQMFLCVCVWGGVRFA